MLYNVYMVHVIMFLIMLSERKIFSFNLFIYQSQSTEGTISESDVSSSWLDQLEHK